MCKNFLKLYSSSPCSYSEMPYNGRKRSDKDNEIVTLIVPQVQKKSLLRVPSDVEECKSTPSSPAFLEPSTSGLTTGKLSIRKFSTRFPEKNRRLTSANICCVINDQLFCLENTKPNQLFHQQHKLIYETII